MEALLQRQEILADSIQKIVTNIKKDSATRKTADYIKKRLESLETLRSEFDANHTLLALEENKTNLYFTSNAHNKLKTICETVCKQLREMKPYSEDERGVPSRTEELISQQRTNFRALERIVRNINFDKMTEKWEIEDKLQILQSRWKTIDDLHWQIDNLLVGTDIDYEQDFSLNETVYESTKTELHRKLNSASHQQYATPKIELPTFTGNYNQWPTFMDLYSEAIHTNTSLNKAQKMQHLKGKLRGEAERLVQHLTVSADNYDTCWDILTHRYNNIQLLFTKQIQIFMNQPNIKHNANEIKRLHDTSLETIHAIHNLGVETTSWDPMLVHILTDKMDPETYTSYMETRKKPRELPSFDELMGFLESKFTALEPINKNKLSQQPKPVQKENQTKFNSTNNGPRFKYLTKTYHTSYEKSCPLCKGNHVLTYCKQFQELTPDAKLKAISALNICQNCLFSHNEKQCISTKRCKVCNKAHHTILHDMLRDTDNTSTPPPPPETKQAGSPKSIPPILSPHKSNHVFGGADETLLATIVLNIKAKDGTLMPMRCLLDQGSQINLITESAAQRLGLERYKQNAAVFGVGTSANHSNGAVLLSCESQYGGYTFTTDALVMPKMIGNLPNNSFNKPNWPHLLNIQLADPDYNISRPVDVLLDARIYSQILVDGILRGPINAPLAQQTKLGWVLLGNVTTFNCHAVLNNIEEISQFWELEDINDNNTNLTADQEYVETLYQTTTMRRPDGRYEVKIPMKPNFEQHLGPSKPQAIAQFKQLEKRLAKNESLSESYKDFIRDYINLGHMKLCTVPREPSCFLPHHGVIRLDSQTTKLRTVFNASAKTKTGSSLNELMECGPNLQQDLQGMILLWRTFQFVYTADIEKFYRQILIQEDDQHLQKIVWRDSINGPIQDYQLCTVTYGTKAAPFLAMRTIKQLVKDDGHKYPLAMDILNKQLYMDDLLGGSNNISEAEQAKQQIINILKGGGFNLRKWASNDSSLLNNINKEQISQNMIDFKHAETNKTLGISWNPCSDQFTFHRALPTSDACDDVITKRTLLSNISKLYDPLGWISPVDQNGQPAIKLLTGKTKLAPLKKPTSLPRLELCGALLLSKLMKKVIESTNLQTVIIYGWTDSMIVLWWLQGIYISRWKSFVANRITKIVPDMPPSCWKHVRSEDNAADCANRGLTPSQLLSHTLWWEGPAWLKETNIPIHQSIFEELLHAHCSMTQTVRVLSWILRFINNTQNKDKAIRTLYLTANETENANNAILPNDDQLMAELQRPRVVTLKTKNSTDVKRPITKIIRLPVEPEPQQEQQPSASAPKTGVEQQQESKTSKKTFKNNFYTFFILFAMCIVSTQQQLINVTALNPNKIVYFDKVADMQIVQDEWKMIIYYNMSTYWRSLDSVEAYVNHLSDICTRETALVSIATQFQHEINELKQNNNLLRSEHGRRSRRGLINGIGYIANSLFGVLDERFAKKYDEDIQSLQSNIDHLTSLYKQHTSILEGENNILKRNEQVMNKQFITINRHLIQLKTNMRKNHDNVMYATTTALAANLLISNLRRVQELLLDLVTDVRSGRMDTHLLKPDEFEIQLNVISGQIPADLSLPCVSDKYNCIRTMYKLSRVHVRLTDNYLIFEVKLPLVNGEQYELHHVIPLQLIKNQSTLHINPTSEYLAVNLKKDLIMPVNSEDIHTSCVHFNANKLLCTLNQPSYDIKANLPMCEAQIVNNKDLSSCRLIVSSCERKWIQLQTPGAWLFTCCQECTTRIFCPTGVTTQTLRGTGIATLSAGCMLKDDNIIIHSPNRFQSLMKTEAEEIYIPQSGINHIINESIIDLDFHTEDHEQQFNNLENKLNIVHHQQETFNQKGISHDVHHYSMYGLITLCIITIICLWVIIKIYQRRFQKQSRSEEEPHIQLQVLNDKKTGDDEPPASLLNIPIVCKVNKATSPIMYHVK